MIILNIVNERNQKGRGVKIKHIEKVHFTVLKEDSLIREIARSFSKQFNAPFNLRIAEDILKDEVLIRFRLKNK